nr:hypothetical protein [Tanacetum cinerariifolium]
RRGLRRQRGGRGAYGHAARRHGRPRLCEALRRHRGGAGPRRCRIFEHARKCPARRGRRLRNAPRPNGRPAGAAAGGAAAGYAHGRRAGGAAPLARLDGHTLRNAAKQAHHAALPPGHRPSAARSGPPVPGPARPPPAGERPPPARDQGPA